jgi:site-specific DNA-adenine methylase
MFYYYGAKNQLARHYPAPEYPLIIEPFAGSAAYSCYHLLRNPSLNAILIEKDKVVADLWDCLLHSTPEDILNWPAPKIGEQTSDFLIMTCAASNAIAKCTSLKYTPRVHRVFNIQRKRLLKFLPIQKQIQIVCASYETAPGIKATWFIDPPYFIGAEVNKNTVFANGNGYRPGCDSNSIDYKQLSKWCRSRAGQVIVCEKEGATWLPFQPLKTNKTSLNKIYKEVVWYGQEKD